MTGASEMLYPEGVKRGRIDIGAVKRSIDANPQSAWFEQAVEHTASIQRAWRWASPTKWRDRWRRLTRTDAGPFVPPEYRWVVIALSIIAQAWLAFVAWEMWAS